MKVQCQCGAKFAFDVTPEMARDPVRFFCPECNLDLSGPINDLIRQELGMTQPAAPAPVPQPAAIPSAGAISIPAAAPRPVVAAATAAPAATSAPRLSIARSASAATHGTPTATAQQPENADGSVNCSKHHEPAYEHCYVCHKPICPKCMELFGYVCSPLCRARADSTGINVPLYAGQKSVREAQQWRKFGLVGGAIAAVVLGLLGWYGWYVLIGSRPHAIFSVRFPDIVYGGSSHLTDKNQIVFLHGGLLARYKLGSKTPVWTNDLVTQKQIDDEIARVTKEFGEEHAKAVREGSDYMPRIPIPMELAKDVTRELQASLGLYVQDQNIWVMRQGKMTHFDWDTGAPGKEIAMPETFFMPKQEGSDILFQAENAFGQKVVTHFNLASGETNVETIGEPIRSAELASSKKPGTTGKNGNGKAAAGLPGRPDGKDADKPMDPLKVAQDAQSLPYAAKVALPATLGNTMHQQQLLREMKNDDPARDSASVADMLDQFGHNVIESKYGRVQWKTKMLQENMVSHSAMKAPPAKSVLDNNPTAGNSLAAANEMLNQMQRDRGGDTVTEDLSRYQVTIHLPDSKEASDWVGEVTGKPHVYQQKSVTVITGGNMLVALDHSNKKLWQADFTHTFRGSGGFFDEDEDEDNKDDEGTTSYGQGPVVEHGDALYVYDEAELSAFDLQTGNVRWRVPSIGIAGLFFDDAGAVYVNTTTADLDSLKYSRQIDITKKSSQAVMRVDCKSGKVLWNVEPGGFVSRVEGKFVLSVTAHQGADLDPDSLTTMPGVNDSVMSIKRLNPKNGKVMWNYVEERAPIYMRFKGNLIECVFRKEVEVLKFLSF